MNKSLFRYTIFPLILILCLILSCENKSEKLNAEADIAAIKEALNQYVEASNNGDLDLLISLWADAGIELPANDIAKIGKAQILEEQKAVFDEMTMEVSITDIFDVKVYGDIGITCGNYSIVMTPKAGGEKIFTMQDFKALTVYKRQSDGSWKVLYDCFNSNIPQNVVQ